MCTKVFRVSFIELFGDNFEILKSKENFGRTEDVVLTENNLRCLDYKGRVEDRVERVGVDWRCYRRSM